MLSFISRRLRLFLRSELDLQKDRLLEQYRGEDSKKVEAERAEFEQRILALAHKKGLCFDRAKYGFVLEGFKHLNSLCLNAGATLNLLEDGQLEVRFGTASLVPETLQEIRILTEIFEDEVYLVEAKEPMYVWDVGANVATASLYFATVHGWDVSAYELFPQTAEAAKRNIVRSRLQDRVLLSAFGVGAKAEKLTLAYNEQSRGSNGMFGNTDPWVTGTALQIDVEIVDAADELQKVLKIANGRPLLAKLDCEGAEYDILPRLIETGQIRSIAALVMEEHILPEHNREELVSAIKNAGFVVRRSRRIDTHVGMLFAARIGN